MPNPMKDEVVRSQLIEKIAAEREVLGVIRSKKLLDDLFEFNKQILRVEEGPGRVPLAPFHQELCSFVETRTKKRRKMILLPRGHLKSTIITVGYSLQHIAKDPNVRILIGNATYPMAVTFLGQIKDHLTKNTTFIDTYGELAKDPLIWKEWQIKLAIGEDTMRHKEATVTAYGMGGNLVSQHYDLIILDDLVNRDTIVTQEAVEKTITVYKDVLDLLEPTGTMVLIGTRWHDADLYGWILEQRDHINVFDIMERQAASGTVTSESVEGEILFPQKYNREYLLQLRREKGPYEFSCQYMNSPVDDDSATFSSNWFRYYEPHEIEGRPLSIFTFIDPAVSARSTADFTGIVTLGMDAYRNIFILDIIRKRFNPTEMINQIFTTYDTFRPRQIALETVAFQQVLQAFIYEEIKKRGVSLPILEVKPDRTERKEWRIRGLVPFYEQGKIYHPRYVPEVKDLEAELTRFPRGRHDDLIDALSYAPKVIFPARVKMEDDEDRRRRRYLY